MWYYEKKKDDTEVIEKLNQLADLLPTRGFDEYYNRIRAEGIKWNRKRVLRVYRLMKLKHRRKRKRRLPTRVKTPLNQPLRSNLMWSADFMYDTLYNGRQIRILNIIDDYNREALFVEAHFSYPGQRVVRALEILEMERGLPEQIRVDNGPEFLSKAFKSYCENKGIEINYIQPGKPVQNAYIERFNRLYREDILDAYLFKNVDQVNELSDKWKHDYNHNHPHKSLGQISPIEYVKSKKLLTVENSTEFTTMNNSDNDDN